MAKKRKHKLEDLVDGIPDQHGKVATKIAIQRRITKEQFVAEIEECWGLVSLLCYRLQATGPQVYRALDHWDLRQYLAECKQGLVHKAECVLLKKLDSENESIQLKAVELIMKSKEARDLGWGQQGVQIQQQINVVSDAKKREEINAIFGVGGGSGGV